MVAFLEKIKRNEATTDEDWRELMIQAHREAPGMTPRAFAEHKTSSGMNSYETLAQELRPLAGREATVMDLACGDGFLIPSVLAVLGTKGRVIGIDMSADELNAARRRVEDARVEFRQATAQNLPLADESVDQIVCHMAFMLMRPLEPVVREIARVLKPGGGFSAVVGHGGSQGVLARVEQALTEFVETRYPGIRKARTDDPRLESIAGLGELFPAVLGFQRIEAVSEFALQVRTNAEGTWDFVKDMYLIGCLSETEKTILQREIVALAQGAANERGEVSFEFPLKMFTVLKCTPL